MADRVIDAAIIGLGGMGRAAARIMSLKSGFRIVGLADRAELAVDPEGLDAAAILKILDNGGRLADAPGSGRKSQNPLADLLAAAPGLEAALLAVPSLPHDLVAGQVRRLIGLGFHGAAVDLLDQSGALGHLLPLEEEVRRAGLTYVTGGGCTPGLLTAAAALMAHSFLEVEGVRIHFGVGIANYLDRDEASLRELLAGWRSLGPARAEALTRAEIQKILDEQGGVLEAAGLAHGDDVLLARAGVTRAERVEVGGRIDTTRDIKPVSTTITVTGLTFDGRQSAHVLTLGDETSMSANTAGPAVGYLARAVELNRRGMTGLFGSTDLMPRFVG